MTLVSTAGKVGKEQPYSLFFSVIVEGRNGESFKLLIPRPIDEVEYEAAIGAFLEFAERLHANTLEIELESLAGVPHRAGATLLVVYDASTRKIRPVDPLGSHCRG